MSMNNLWDEVDVREYCCNRLQELQKEEPVNGVALKQYKEDLLTAAMGNRTFTVSTCEMLKDLIRTKLVLLQESCAPNLENETSVYVTEAVQVAENFCNSHSQEGGADVSGKTAETVGKKAEKILKQLDEAEKILNMTMREQEVMAKEKALLERESAMAASLLERESAMAWRESQRWQRGRRPC